MYDWWVLQLAKLSVSRKLMVGFGVLLALLLLVVISSNRTSRTRPPSASSSPKSPA